MLRFAAVVILGLSLLQGCVSDHIEAKGIVFSRTALFYEARFGDLEYDPSTGKFKITSYAGEVDLDDVIDYLEALR